VPLYGGTDRDFEIRIVHHHDADDDSGDDDELPGECTQVAETQEAPPDAPLKPEYAVLGVDNRLVQVHVDSEAYQSAANPQEPDQDISLPAAAATAVRVEDIIDSLSDSEWDEAQHMPSMDAFMEFLTSAQPTAYATDVEGTASRRQSLSITITHARESFLMIPSTVDLALCREDEGLSFSEFCVRDVRITEGTQVFIVTEPCVAANCKHLPIQVMHEEELRTEEMRFELTSLSFRGHGSSVMGDGDQGANIRVVALLPCKSKPDRDHHHTMFEHGGGRGCALPADLKIFASVQATVDDSDGSDTETECISPKAGFDRYETDRDQGLSLGWAAVQYNQFPTKPGLGDDEEAFELLRPITLYDIYEPPGEVERPLLVRFLSLADKIR
jgi:hypothetical protein